MKTAKRKSKSKSNSTRVRELHKILSRLSGNLTYLENIDAHASYLKNKGMKENNSLFPSSKKRWDKIAWDIASAEHEIRNRAELPDFDYSVLHSLRAIVFDTDQEICAMEIIAPKKLPKIVQEALERIQSFTKELDTLRGKLREVVHGEQVHDTGKTAKQPKRKRKAPSEFYKQARERSAAKIIDEFVAETGKLPTSRYLAKKLDCDPATIVRMEAWKKRDEASYDRPKGLVTRQKDDSYIADGVVQPDEF